MPTTSSALAACPMCAPKLRTPSMSRSSLLPWVVIRTISGCEVPGVASQCIRKSRSLKSGSSVWPSAGATTTPPARTRAKAPNTIFVRASNAASVAM